MSFVTQVFLEARLIIFKGISACRKKDENMSLSYFFIFLMIRILKSYIQIRTFDYTHLGFQFSDFQLKSFVDPKPVEL